MTNQQIAQELLQTMTEKTIQLNLTEEQFNMIWNALVLSADELVDEDDIRVNIETLNEMEDIMEELGLEVFGDVDDD
jgi:flagellin-specific chaperone FliS